MVEASWRPYMGKMEVKVNDNETREVPIPSWSYTGGLLSGGSVHAWTHEGYFSFKPTRPGYPGITNVAGRDLDGSDPTELLEAIDSHYGWGTDLPHLTEIREEIDIASRLLKRGKISDFLRECEGIEIRWSDIFESPGN